MPNELDLLFSEPVPNDVQEVYDSTSVNWNPDPAINQLFLRTVHNFLLDRLRARGHVFLNDIHDELGMPHTPIGQIRGWLLNDERQDSQTPFRFWQEEEAPGAEGILLHFSTDGPIWNRI